MYRQYLFIALVILAASFQSCWCQELPPEEVELEHSEPEHELCPIEQYDNSASDSIAVR